jgi:DNA-binding GntR family transcriptional regulator
MNAANIGEAAGTVWNTLAERGAITLSALAKHTKLSPVLLHAAIGWLAREGKLVFETNGKTTTIALTESERAAAAR